jgi:6,7-dimethyl-8-ribityllumazine synthase
MTKGVKMEAKDGTGLKVGIVCARWNSEMTNALQEQCKKALLDCKIKEEDIKIISVPGAYEVVYGATQLIESEEVDAVICLGTLIKGGTMHFEYISEAVTYGIMKLNVETNIPVIFGILTCLSEEQAKERSIGDKSHGYDWGLTAVEMALLRSNI